MKTSIASIKLFLNMYVKIIVNLEKNSQKGVYAWHLVFGNQCGCTHTEGAMGKLLQF